MMESKSGNIQAGWVFLLSASHLGLIIMCFVFWQEAQFVKRQLTQLREQAVERGHAEWGRIEGKRSTGWNWAFMDWRWKEETEQ